MNQSWPRRIHLTTQLTTLAFGITYLSACTTLTTTSESTLSPTVAASQISAATQARAEHISSWTLSGAIAAKKGHQAWSALLTWQQMGAQHDVIQLFAPLGGRHITLEHNHGTITYRDGNITKQGLEATTWLEHETGIAIPTEQLFYWIRGLPSPGHITQSKRNPDHTYQQFTQANYTLRYPEYMTVQQIALPHKIELIDHQGTAHQGQVKLVIKKWTLN